MSSWCVAGHNEGVRSVRDITEAVAADSSLSPDERESLLESLELSQEELQDPDTDGEEAFVSMSDLESDLREQVESMRDDLTDQDSRAKIAEQMYYPYYAEAGRE